MNLEEHMLVTLYKIGKHVENGRFHLNFARKLSTVYSASDGMLSCLTPTSTPEECYAQIHKSIQDGLLAWAPGNIDREVCLTKKGYKTAVVLYKLSRV